MSRMTLPSSHATRPLGKPTSRASQDRNKKTFSPERRGQTSPPETQDRDCRPDAISTGPSRCFALDAHRVLSSSSQVSRMSRWASRSAQTGASERPSCQEWARHPLPDRGPLFPRPLYTDQECVLGIIHRESQWQHISSSLFSKRLRYALKQPWPQSACAK